MAFGRDPGGVPRAVIAQRSSVHPPNERVPSKLWTHAVAQLGSISLTVRQIGSVIVQKSRSQRKHGSPVQRRIIFQSVQSGSSRIPTATLCETRTASLCLQQRNSTVTLRPFLSASRAAPDSTTNGPQNPPTRRIIHHKDGTIVPPSASRPDTVSR